VIQEKVLGKEHSDIATSYNNLGFVYSHKQDYLNAINYYQKALILREKILGKEHPSIADLYNNLGFVYLAKGEKQKGVAYFQKIWFGKEAKFKQAEVINQVGIQTFRRNQFTSAINLYTYALELLENDKVPREEALWAFVYQNLAKAHCYSGDQKQALSLFEKALELAKYSKIDTTIIISNYEACKKK